MSIVVLIVFGFIVGRLTSMMDIYGEGLVKL